MAYPPTKCYGCTSWQHFRRLWLLVMDESVRCIFNVFHQYLTLRCLLQPVQNCRVIVTAKHMPDARDAIRSTPLSWWLIRETMLGATCLLLLLVQNGSSCCKDVLQGPYVISKLWEKRKSEIWAHATMSFRLLLYFSYYLICLPGHGSQAIGPVSPPRRAWPLGLWTRKSAPQGMALRPLDP